MSKRQRKTKIKNESSTSQLNTIRMSVDEVDQHSLELYSESQLKQSISNFQVPDGLMLATVSNNKLGARQNKFLLRYGVFLEPSAVRLPGEPRYVRWYCLCTEFCSSLKISIALSSRKSALAHMLDRHHVNIDEVDLDDNPTVYKNEHGEVCVGNQCYTADQVKEAMERFVPPKGFEVDSSLGINPSKRAFLLRFGIISRPIAEYIDDGEGLVRQYRQWHCLCNASCEAKGKKLVMNKGESINMINHLDRKHGIKYVDVDVTFVGDFNKAVDLENQTDVKTLIKAAVEVAALPLARPYTISQVETEEPLGNGSIAGRWYLRLKKIARKERKGAPFNVDYEEGQCVFCYDGCDRASLNGFSGRWCRLDHFLRFLADDPSQKLLRELQKRQTLEVGAKDKKRIGPFCGKKMCICHLYSSWSTRRMIYSRTSKTKSFQYRFFTRKGPGSFVKKKKVHRPNDLLGVNKDLCKVGPERTASTISAEYSLRSENQKRLRFQLKPGSRLYTWWQNVKGQTILYNGDRQAGECVFCFEKEGLRRVKVARRSMYCFNNFPLDRELFCQFLDADPTYNLLRECARRATLKGEGEKGEILYFCGGEHCIYHQYQAFTLWRKTHAEDKPSEYFPVEPLYGVKGADPRFVVATYLARGVDVVKPPLKLRNVSASKGQNIPVALESIPIVNTRVADEEFHEEFPWIPDELTSRIKAAYVNIPGSMLKYCSIRTLRSFADLKAGDDLKPAFKRYGAVSRRVNTYLDSLDITPSEMKGDPFTHSKHKTAEDLLSRISQRQLKLSILLAKSEEINLQRLRSRTHPAAKLPTRPQSSIFKMRSMQKREYEVFLRRSKRNARHEVQEPALKAAEKLLMNSWKPERHNALKAANDLYGASEEEVCDENRAVELEALVRNRTTNALKCLDDSGSVAITIVLEEVVRSLLESFRERVVSGGNDVGVIQLSDTQVDEFVKSEAAAMLSVAYEYIGSRASSFDYDGVLVDCLQTRLQFLTGRSLEEQGVLLKTAVFEARAAFKPKEINAPAPRKKRAVGVRNPDAKPPIKRKSFKGCPAYLREFRRKMLRPRRCKILLKHLSG